MLLAKALVGTDILICKSVQELTINSAGLVRTASAPATQPSIAKLSSVFVKPLPKICIFLGKSPVGPAVASSGTKQSTVTPAVPAVTVKLK